ncbi:EBNA-LP [Macacine gammaherpesvirus 4]|uniref:EBNA-LP n=2 Tax=Macacine gammaherpesvirus 4 TaxID=45455 RepID=Q8UZJ5_9GAMA|nr:EBNA-LP [Macacine gammaherpesvirus 4]AAK95413.1 EBNA-LP [Macacine gammaherpesvirus 4]
MGDPSEATGPSRPGPPGLGPEGPFGDLLRRRRHNSPTGGDPQGPTRVRRRVFLEEEDGPVSGPPVRGDPSEATGPSRPGPPGLGPEGPFGDLLRRRRHNSPTGGDPQGPTRVRRRVFLEEEDGPVSGPPVRGDPSEATGPSRPGPPGLGPEGPFGDLLRRRRHNSPTGGDPQGPTRVRRRVFLEEEDGPVSGPPVRGDPSEATGPSRPGPPGLGPEGPFGDLLRRRRHNSPTGGDPQGPTRVRRRVFLEEEDGPVSGPPVRGDPSEATGPSRPGPPGLGPEGPFGDLLRRRRHNSPTGGDPQGPTRVRRRVFLEEEDGPVSGPPVRPQGPLIQPGARSWSEWLARSRQRTNPQQVTTTCRRRVYIEEEEEI